MEQKYYIIDKEQPGHPDNTREYTKDEALAFVKELIQIEKESSDYDSVAALGEPTKDNIQKWLAHYCYRLKKV